MTTTGYALIADAFAEAARLWLRPGFADRAGAIEDTLKCSNTFTPEALETAVDTIMSRLQRGVLDSWIAGRCTNSPCSVAVLNAGNVPFVGLQDLLAVACTGHTYLGIVSSKSPHLLPSFVSTVARILPRLRVSFSGLETALNRCDALIATGADTTVNQIESAAAKAGIDPRRILLRGTRISVAVLDGREINGELDALARDALLHEGRGCLNVCIIFAPADQDWGSVLASMSRLRSLYPPHESTVQTIQQEALLYKATGQRYHQQAGVLLVDGEPEPKRPGVVVWSRYSTLRDVEDWIDRNADRLQAVIVSARVALRTGPVGMCLPGQSHDPPLDWAPDRRDTVEFLVGV